MQNLLKRVYNSRRLSISFLVLGHVISIICALSLIPLFLLLWSVSTVYVIELLAILAIPFLLVSIFRRLVNAPRPYELYGFYESLPKSKMGRSFPSRHAFSAFAIGTVLCAHIPALGVIILFLGVILCTLRVLLGIHFVRDVVAGALIGIISSLIGLLIMRLGA